MSINTSLSSQSLQLVLIYFYIKIGLLDLSQRGKDQSGPNVAGDVVDGQVSIVNRVGLSGLLVNY